jgi:hypothetical protein
MHDVQNQESSLKTAKERLHRQDTLKKYRNSKRDVKKIRSNLACDQDVP